uniref:Uncharacterized protein n=1 Tax=Arion vulgaris TaxID=1028688 RepID=A0A0B7BFG6_9EUPU
MFFFVETIINSKIIARQLCEALRKHKEQIDESKLERGNLEMIYWTVRTTAVPCCEKKCLPERRCLAARKVYENSCSVLS